MEWILFVLIALAAAAYIVLPQRSRDVPADAGDALRAERAGLLALLRELDDDAAAGRISTEDRREGRRALAPRLRAVTEALDTLGEPREAPTLARPDQVDGAEIDAGLDPGPQDGAPSAPATALDETPADTPAERRP